MKTVEYTRVQKSDTVSLCEMQFNKDGTLTLKFGKKNGGNLKFPNTFIADSVEHYLNHLMKLALKEIPCPLKKARRKK